MRASQLVGWISPPPRGLSHTLFFCLEHPSHAADPLLKVTVHRCLLEKQGMFNNANVIFRTRFVDGVSTVSRTITGGRADAIANVPESEADVPKKKRGKAVGTKAAKATGTKGKARAGENIIPNIV